MRLNVCVIAGVVACMAPGLPGGQAEQVRVPVEWGRLPALPDRIGFGGPICGVHNGALLVAGGANFPAKPPWEDGKKVWHDGIFVLESPAAGQWKTAGKLARPLAYAACVPTVDGLLVIGGSDAEKTRADVTRLTWDAASGTVERETLPALPEPAAFLVAGRIGEIVYAGSGKTTKDPATCSNRFWKLDLGPSAKELAWRRITDLPGRGRLKAAAAVQSAGDKPKFLYVFGGVHAKAGDGDEVRQTSLSEVWRLDPRAGEGKGRWRRMADMPDALAAMSVIDFGQSHVLLFSGSTGKHIPKPIEDRPLFRRNVLVYHTLTDTWVRGGLMPEGVVTTPAVRWGDRIVIPSGETRPGVRTPGVQAARPTQPEMKFGWINYGVLSGYLVLLVAMGVYFSRREKSTEDFFLAGKRIPWWAAGLSIYATQLSAITFIASPAVSYSKDWLIYPGKITLFLMAPVVVFFYLPFFRRLKITTAYEYLEKRFSTPVRLFGSASFIVFQLGRMAVVVYLPALALSAVTGINLYACVVVMAALSIVYTALGGMEAVVWTDVVQTVVLLGGMLVSLVVVLWLVGGVGVVWRTAMADDKLRMFNWSWDSTTLATWSMFIGSFALQFGPYTTDQAVIQRYLSTKDERAAAKGIWTNGILSIPFGFLFMALGTCLYVYLKRSPELTTVGMRNDEVFPLFIVQQLPAGVSGLVIAGVFAASMSTLDSSMHSIATAITTDWYRRFRPRATDRQSLSLARAIVVIVGLLAMGTAAYMARSDIKSAFFLFQKILGLISSALVGIFILGVFTRRANTPGALAGAAASLGLLLYIFFYTQLHFYLYAVIGILTCVAVGYVVSLATPRASRPTDGLNWPTRKRPVRDAE